MPVTSDTAPGFAASPADPLLRGAFEPLLTEYDVADARVSGMLPADLAGTLYRIGPNPQFAPRGRYNPLQGDGMVHAFHFGAGRVAYRNRWVRTAQWRRERAAGRALYATSGDPRDAEPVVRGAATDGVANTHLLWHDGRLLALEEGHAPIALDPDTLDTHGPFDFGGALATPLTAHPKVDPQSGAWLGFANFPERRFDGALRLLSAAPGGALRQHAVAGPFPALVHDCAITPRWQVFIIGPLTLSLERLRAGRPPIAWEPDRGTWLGLVARGADGAATGPARWWRGPAAMAWHVVNAWEDSDTVVLDVCQQQAPAFADSDGRMAPDADLRQYLTRWRIDPGRADLAAPRRLSSTVCEYPRIDERRTGRAHRCAWVACGGGPGTGDLLHRAIGRFDDASGTMVVWPAGPGCAVSEPVFVPAAAGSPATPAGDAGAGWLLVVVHDEVRRASRLVVLDAHAIDTGPVATVWLDHRVPMGFHGLWRPTART